LIDPDVRAAWLSRRRIAKGQSTLWQQRFWEHLIRDERDFAGHVDYVHWPLLRIPACACGTRASLHSGIL